MNRKRIPAWAIIATILLIFTLSCFFMWLCANQESGRLAARCAGYEATLTEVASPPPTATLTLAITQEPTQTPTPTPTVVPELHAELSNANHALYTNEELNIMVRTNRESHMEIDWDLLDKASDDYLQISDDRYAASWIPRRPGKRHLRITGRSLFGTLSISIPLEIVTPLALPVATAQPRSGQVCIVVFEDSNGNGQEESSESRIVEYKAAILDHRQYQVGSKSADTPLALDGTWCRVLSEGLYSIVAEHPSFVMPTQIGYLRAGSTLELKIPAVTATPTLTLTPRPPATKVPAPTPRSAPILRFPDDRHQFNREIARFEWDAFYALRQGETFHLRVRQEGAESAPCPEGATDCLDVFTEGKTHQWWPGSTGTYIWTVSIYGPQGEITSLTSERRLLFYYAPSPLQPKRPKSDPVPSRPAPPGGI